MRTIALLLLVAGCAAAQPEPAPFDGFAWQGKIGEGARVFGSAEASQEALLNDADGCDWVGLRQPVSEREGLFLQCMALRGWQPIRLPK